MERVELKAQNRTILGSQVKRLRADAWIPAVVYGPDTPAQPIQLQERDLYLALRKAGSTSLINLMLESEAKPFVVLAREIQRDALTSRVQHVDFYQVRLTEKVKTTPRIEFVGESPMVKANTGVVIHHMNEVEVECLPTDLISSVEVDVSSLESMDDSIVVGDLSVPPGVTILADPEDVVVSVVPVRVALEEELEEIEEAAEEVEGEEAADEEDTEAEA